MSVPARNESSSPEYWELDAKVPTSCEELWSLFCFARGATGAWVLEEGETLIHQRYYFGGSPPARVEQWADDFQRDYQGADRPLGLRCRVRSVEDWQAEWRRHFKPLNVGQRLLVCPPWDIPGSGGAARRLPVVIDPRQGFGTGYHASTHLALTLLESRMAQSPPHPHVVDVGTGSGILAIAAARLGASAVWALDIDMRVLPEVKDNWAANGLAVPLAAIQGGPGCLGGNFPLVVANIVTEVLLHERDTLAELTAPGGTLILSGILEAERPAIGAAYADAGFVLQQQAFREGWWGCAMIRQSNPNQEST